MHSSSLRPAYSPSATSAHESATDGTATACSTPATSSAHTTSADGAPRHWKRDNKLHRTDGPAVVFPDGSREWWVDGKRHRIDGPAVDRADGYRSWWLYGQLHRSDGPAIEVDTGLREWHLFGRRHRIDGPAVEHEDGSKQWFVLGKRHRSDGPAIEIANGVKNWWLDDKRREWPFSPTLWPYEQFRSAVLQADCPPHDDARVLDAFIQLPCAVRSDAVTEALVFGDTTTQTWAQRAIAQGALCQTGAATFPSDVGIAQPRARPIVIFPHPGKHRRPSTTFTP